MISKKQTIVYNNSFEIYDITSFYESGSLFISAIEKIDPCSLIDMKKLFCEMQEYILLD